ncbi:hypothetical protein H5U98_25530 [Mycolicibacterium boenickei]|uniref:Uncharacterized protein n=1 Tax=Mycolicibacterium boenickei TaxID=146017 RepID=A0AAX2ZUJ8_9MYCO|nr:hypothetical protein [Mycolicibacterium boenickei]UNB98828.1 hypothetical protein H5U98_25530 [Mycolicibacterium boenickei]BBX88392.1 hypothetical protein MBOE_00410 [Mycolicibacterium boenickei]
MQVHRAIYPVLDRDLARISSFSYPSGGFRERTEIPIEGVGIVRVVTEVPDADPGYGFTDVTLARYRDGELTPPIPLAGSVSESTVARCMHEHWCDLQRLIRCIRADTKTLCILDIDWEIDDDDVEDADEPSTESCPDPGLTPRILEIAERARTTRLGIDSLAHD